MAAAVIEQFLPGVENDRLFSFANELKLAQEVLREHLAPQAVLSWLRHQVESFLTEFGVGEALSIQPSYWFELQSIDGDHQVFSLNIPEYGEQSESYVSVEGFPHATGEGLISAYRLLSSADAGDGVIIVSPTEFYEEYGSRYDVANLFRVVEVRDDGYRLVEGRFLLLNGGLTSYERAFLLNWHDLEARVSADASAHEIVRRPQRFHYREQILDEEDPIAAHAAFINYVFKQQFGKDLLGGDNDMAMYETVRELVDRRLHSLHQFLLVGDKERFIGSLRGMMFGSQREWARERGIDPEAHIQDILFGRVSVGGIHPITGLPVDDGLDSMLNGIESCGEVGSKHCAEHGDYEGKACPECRKLAS